MSIEYSEGMSHWTETVMHASTGTDLFMSLCEHNHPHKHTHTHARMPAFQLLSVGNGLKDESLPFLNIIHSPESGEPISTIQLSFLPSPIQIKKHSL